MTLVRKVFEKDRTLGELHLEKLKFENNIEIVVLKD